MPALFPMTGGINIGVPAGVAATITGVGTLIINPDGSYTFTPAPNYDGAVPPGELSGD